MYEYKYNIRLDYIVRVIAEHFDELPKTVKRKFVNSVKNRDRMISLNRSQIEGFLKENFNELPEDCKDMLRFAWDESDELHAET